MPTLTRTRPGEAAIFVALVATFMAPTATAAPPGPTGAVGGYGSGSLVDGVAMPDRGPDHELLFPARCYATPAFASDYADTALRENVYGHANTVQAVLDVAAAVRAREPTAPRVIVAELSNAHGGKIPYHITHQNGLDVDVLFLQPSVKTCTPYGYLPRFEELDKKTAHWQVTKDFELAWNWALAATFAARKDVKMIFVGPLIEDALAAWARSHGVSAAERSRTLAKLVTAKCSGKTKSPYYQGNWCPHDDHFHVRFHCPKDSRGCRPRVR